MKRIELLNRIQEIYSKLENDSLESSEIDELVDLSNKLYERALILRYKIAEQRIFGENQNQSTNEIADKTDDLSEINSVESQISEAIDFSIFESQEAKILEVEAATPQDEPVVNTLETELNFDANLSEPEQEKIEVEENLKEQIVDLVTATVQEEVSEELEVPEQKNVETENKTSDWKPFFNKILNDHSTGIQKAIENLSGSFGLNERILYINELFNGDAEKFSNAIIQLDKIGDWNNCVSALINHANSENWDKESDTVGEFVLHVNRKYA